MVDIKLAPAAASIAAVAAAAAAAAELLDLLPDLPLGTAVVVGAVVADSTITLGALRWEGRPKNTGDSLEDSQVLGFAMEVDVIQFLSARELWK